MEPTETTCQSLTLQISNLPIPFSPAFSADELVLLIGSCINDPTFVINSESGLLSAANPGFLEIVEWSPDEASEMPFHLLVHPDERSLIQGLCSGGVSADGKSFDLRLVSRSGKETEVEATLVPVRWSRQEYLLGFIRRSRGGHGWREEVAEQKKRTLEAVKSSVRIYQITEKIRRTLALTKSLLNTENEAQLFETAARILTADGLNYREVTFLLVNENLLEVRHSTKPFIRGRYPLFGENRYARFVRQNFREDRDSEEASREEILVPLRSRGQFLGLIEVGLLGRERIFFDTHPMVSEWQQSVLFTVGDIIGLHLDNMQLYGEVKRRSVIDPLTATYNRRYFMGRLSAEINRCTRAGSPVAIIFIDVDELKPINDAHGHLQGDQVLRDLGTLFLNNLREADCVCRYGGDEFVVLLPEVDDEQAKMIGDKLLAAVREHRFFLLDSPEKCIDVSISLGVSVLEEGQDEEMLLKAADSALLRAKKLGRNRCESFKNDSA